MQKNNNLSLGQLLKNSRDPAKMQEVFDFAAKHYHGQQYLDADLYIDHALRVALAVSRLGLQEPAVRAALLYHAASTPDELSNRAILEFMKKHFGEEAAMLAEHIAGHNLLFSFIAEAFKEYDLSNEQRVENLRKLFLAAGKDVRAAIINLASRIDRLEHAQHLPQDARKRLAGETLRLHMPVANRLGLGGVKASLEDLSFAMLMPEKFKLIQEKIQEKYDERQKYLDRLMPGLKRMLHREHIGYLEISWRAKSYWSTYQKLVKKGMDFSKIYDLKALRIIVKDIPACYRTLGIIHKHYQPISEEIDDYIARPKSNGYRSLHTAVILGDANISEIQIRTPQMHYEAEYGVCAHWWYKEHHGHQESFPAWAKEMPGFSAGRVDLFENQVFSFTPKGDIISLPKGSTPVDFAYAIHSEIGNSCQQAKVNGKIAPLSCELNTGDVVEIITKKGHRPSLDWLKFVKTGFAKSNIKKATAAVITPILSAPAFVVKKFIRISERIRKKRQKPIAENPGARAMRAVVGGQYGIAVHYAKCCNPQPGEPVVAYLAKNRAAVIHRESCKNLQAASTHMPEKIVQVAWGDS